jgi:NADPH:quinone reductase-like Zn-dependent oxidoreductase
VHRTLIFNQFGRPTEVLKFGQAEETVLKNEEVLVKMCYVPINPSDILPITGAYAHRTILPSIPGYEGMGVIVKVGNHISKTRIGQRVLPLRGDGLWQEYVKCDADFAVLVPETINDIAASQLYINPLTAWVLCKEILKVQKGQIVAINAANSAFGRIIIQLSRILDFHVLAIVRKENHIDELRSLGAVEVIKCDGEELLLKLENWIIDAAIDLVGGISGTCLAQSVKSGGLFQTIGLLSGKQVDWNRISSFPIKSGLFHLRYWNEKQTVATWQNRLNEVINLVSNNQLKLNTNFKIFNYEEAQEGLKLYEKGKNGKIIIKF